MSTLVLARDLALPWDSDRADLKNFRFWLLIFLAITVVSGVIVPFITLPEVEREELEELPPQLARILLEKKKPPPPPPPPEVKKEVEKKEPEKKVVEEKVEPKKKPETKVADPKEKAKVSGLLAFQDTFADMREAVDVSKLQDTGAIQQGSGQAATIDRSLLTSKHGTRSAGVNVATLSRDTGGVALSGRETTKVEVKQGAKGKGGARKPKQSNPRERSIEDIRRVFDSNKGSIFAIYNRALRSDPTLQGQVILELVIDPQGKVTKCRVITSEIDDSSVVAKIVNRVRLFDFGKRSVGTTTISYPVHFLPS